ncbi:MAG: hypothetical protein ACTHLE_11155 [Agriterribacter sp.]
MELDELKEIWKQAEATQEVPHRSNDEILQMMQEPSKSPVAKMRRNLLMELLVVVISVSCVSIYYFTAFEGRLQEVSWAYIVLALLFFGYYYQKNKLLKSMQCVACRVKSNLELQLKTLEKYVKLYLIIGTALIPVMLCFLYYLVLSYKKIPISNSFGMSGNEDKFTLLYLLFTVTFTVVLYFLNRWYIHFLYGRHISKLKALIREMEE